MKLLMIMCEASSLSTTDLLRRDVANELSKSKVKGRIGLLRPSMASATQAFIMNLFLPIYHGYKLTKVLKISA